MKKIIDPIFGELVYKISWKGHVHISLWGQKKDLSVVLRDSTKEGVTVAQQDSFAKLKESMGSIIEENVDAIEKYCRVAFGLKDMITPELISHVKPTSLYIQRNGAWAVIFECDFDPEHGIALFEEAQGIVVSSLDDFL